MARLRSSLLRTALLSTACLLVGGWLGVQYGSANAKPSPAPSHHSRFQKVDVLARAIAVIEQYYVRPIDDSKLLESAIRGMVAELDPHSSYLPPRAAKLLREEIEGSFGGIGMTVTYGRDPEGRLYLDIRDVIPDGPAYRADIRSGDHIVRIEGQSIAEFADMQRALETIRGEVGSQVTITIEEPDRGIVRTVTLTRDTISAPAVESRVLGDGIVVIRLREFTEHATRQVKDAMAELSKTSRHPVQGLILDLRDNGGGLLNEAVGIVNLFVEDGAIVRTRGRDGRVLYEARAHYLGTEPDLPLVVLVNKASASASEIVAGALQDHRRAIIIGERTYGKGSVQAPFEMRDGSLLKLTTALYFTPQDRLIQASGIVPDVFVGAADPISLPNLDSRAEIRPERDVPGHLTPEAFGRPTPTTGDESIAVRDAGTDLQLRTAVQHLQAWAQVAPAPY